MTMEELLQRLRRVPHPRTLLWRTTLLIALLMVLSLGAWLTIYERYAVQPRAQQVAQLLVSVVNLTRNALLASDINQRYALLYELSTQEGIRIYPAEAEDHPRLVEDTPVIQEVRRRLGPHTRMATELAGEEGFFVSFRLDEDVPDDEYWVMLPPERFARARGSEWLFWGAVVGVLALLGAYFLVLGVTRSLKNLERAAREVGKGHLPPPLPESGPSEVAEVATAFNQMSHDLAQLESDRALILAGVSHDLRTPLARLRLGIEMSGAAQEDVDAMCGDIEEMDRIISQFLDFARGAQAEAVSETDLQALAAEVLQPYTRRKYPVSLKDGPPVPARIRPLALRRAIANLIDNALRYAGSELPIELTVHAQGGRVSVEVADRGPGIPPEETERLKRPFTRLETARTDAKGSGLGLAIVDRVARLHGGQLLLLPREGGGLCARLVLQGA
ncbi:MAG: ATP-binding protein [Moraxellaceae bacterium]|nr:ATP-binding protein [Moraxellaceae bacterium]